MTELIERGVVNEIVIEEFSRIGRNTGDVIQTLEWLEENEVNVIVRNLGLQSRPNGKKNPIWKMISSVMSSLYEQELENIKERTKMGRLVYVQKGVKLKETGTTNWISPNTGATNESGFTALLAGNRYHHGTFNHVGTSR